MAASSVEICNWALIEVGSSRIAALSGTELGAVLCNEQYDKQRKKLISAHPWNFATTYVALAEDASEPIIEFDHQFTLPSDVIRVLKTDLPEDAEWEVGLKSTGSRILLCNSDEVNIKYLKNLTDTTLFPPYFDEALAMAIAANISYAMTQSSTVKQLMEAKARDSLVQARLFDAQEHGRTFAETNTWINVRG